MALIIRGKAECALCEVVLNANDKVIATSHFIADTEDPLWRFSDAAMHQNCFLEWDKDRHLSTSITRQLGILLGATEHITI
jgi:hypothetical protein